MFPWTAKIYHIYCNSMDQLAVIRCWVFLGSSSVKPSWSRGDEASLFFYFILFVCLFLYLFPNNVSFRFQIFLRLCQIRQVTLLLGCITLLGSLLFLNLCGPCFELCTNLWRTCGTLPLWKWLYSQPRNIALLFFAFDKQVPEDHLIKPWCDCFPRYVYVVHHLL